MAILNRRPLFLVLFVLMSFSIPQPALGTPLFDLSPQIDAISKIDLQADPTDSLDTFFDNVTTLPSFEHICQTIPETHSLHQQAQLLISMQHAMIYLLMPLMSMVKRYQAYWQEQLHRPYAYFLSKPPHRWFRGKPQKEDLQDTLKMLTIIENNIAEHIGTLKNHLDEYAVIQTMADLQEIVEQQHIFLVTFFGNSPQSNFKTNMTLIGEGFAQYHKSIYDLARTYKRANHFSRNWIAYTTAGLCLGAAACWYFKDPIGNKSWINLIIEKRKQDVGNFVQDYLVKPYNLMLDALFNKKDSTDFIHVPDSIAFKNDYLASNIKDCQVVKAKYKISDEILPPELFTYEEIRKAKDPEAVQNFWNKYAVQIFTFRTVAEKKGYFSFFGSISPITTEEIAFYKISILDAIARFNQHYKDATNQNRLNFALLASLPALLASYLSFNGFKYIYQKLAPHKVAHKGILITLLQVEELLNDNAHKDALETKELGMLTYYLGLLYEYSQDLSLQEHYDFCKDLNKLFNTIHTMSQKLKDIDIIRKKYQFLA